MLNGLGRHVCVGAKWKGLGPKDTYLRSLAICLGRTTMRSTKSGAERLDRGLIPHLGAVDKVTPMEQLFPRNRLFSLC